MSVLNQCISLTSQVVKILKFYDYELISFLVTTTSEDFCNEEHIYFYYLNLELIYQYYQFLFYSHLQYYSNNLTYYD